MSKRTVDDGISRFASREEEGDNEASVEHPFRASSSCRSVMNYRPVSRGSASGGQDVCDFSMCSLRGAGTRTRECPIVV